MLKFRMLESNNFTRTIQKSLASDLKRHNSDYYQSIPMNEYIFYSKSIFENKHEECISVRLISSKSNENCGNILLLFGVEHCAPVAPVCPSIIFIPTLASKFMANISFWKNVKLIRKKWEQFKLQGAFACSSETKNLFNSNHLLGIEPIISLPYN